MTDHHHPDLVRAEHLHRVSRLRNRSYREDRPERVRNAWRRRRGRG